MKARYRLLIAKTDLKFSSAHFTIFGSSEAEPLHGHNYRVEVELGGDRLDSLGLLCDLASAKRMLRALCARLDERILVPGRAPGLELRPKGEEIELLFGDRRYVLPVAEVLTLDVSNVTIEELAAYVWRAIVAELGLSDSAGAGFDRVSELAVRIEETQGQSCRFEAPLGR